MEVIEIASNMPLIMLALYVKDLINGQSVRMCAQEFALHDMVLWYLLLFDKPTDK